MSEQKQDNLSAIPWITIDPKTLPSRGLTYPEGGTVRYRTYSFGEVKAVSAGNSPPMVELVESALRGIETSGFGKDQLTLFDCFYIGLLRKISTTQGSQYKVPYLCGDCDTEGEAVFSEKSLDFNFINEVVTEFPIRATICGQEIQFAPLKVRDFLALNKGRYKKVIKGGEPDRVAYTAASVVSPHLDFEKAYNLFFGLTDESEVEVLEEIDKLMMHDVKPIKHTCRAEIDGRICNFENEIVLQGREAFIRPFRAGEPTVRSRIHFGVPQPS